MLNNEEKIALKQNIISIFVDNLADIETVNEKNITEIDKYQNHINKLLEDDTNINESTF